MVTLLGLIIMASSVVLIYSQDNKFEKICSDFTYIYLLISFFLYQTLDAIDGKHARNTGRSSPLGMLMDHGCDSLVNSFILVNTFQALQFRGELILITVQGLTQVSSYHFIVIYLYSFNSKDLDLPYILLLRLASTSKLGRRSSPRSCELNMADLESLNFNLLAWL